MISFITCNYEGCSGKAKYKCECSFLVCEDHSSEHELSHPESNYHYKVAYNKLEDNHIAALNHTAGLFKFMNRIIGREMAKKNTLEQQILQQINTVEEKYRTKLIEEKRKGKLKKLLKRSLKKCKGFSSQIQEIERVYLLRIFAICEHKENTRKFLSEVKAAKVLQNILEHPLGQQLSKLLRKNRFSNENIQKVIKRILKEELRRVEYPALTRKASEEEQKEENEGMGEPNTHTSNSNIEMNFALSSSPEIFFKDNSHKSMILATGVSDYGNMIATGDENGHICLRKWNQTGTVTVANFEEHTDAINYLDFSLQNNLLASSSKDKTVKIWDLSTFECIFTYTQHSSEVNSACFSPNSAYIVSGGRDAGMHLWSTKDGRIESKLGQNIVRKAVFTKDGQWIVSQSMNNDISIWDFKSRSLVRTFENPNDKTGIFCIQDHLLVIGGNNNTIRIWDMRNNELIQELDYSKPHQDILSSLDISECKKYLVTTGFDDRIYIRDLATGELTEAIEGIQKPRALFMKDKIVMRSTMGKTIVLRLARS